MILVVCALAAELPGFKADDRLEIVPCGLGLVEAAAATTEALAARRYSAVINAGIGGIGDADAWATPTWSARKHSPT
jgi:nucleoside phosphorylase